MLLFFKEGQDLDPCVSFPCQRNGTCKRESNTNYKCSCLSIAYGDDCEYGKIYICAILIFFLNCISFFSS